MSRDWVSLKDALVAFRAGITANGEYIEQAANLSEGGGRFVEAEGWAQPDWARPDQFTARHRLLEVGKIVAERVLVGWQGPTVEEVLAVELSEQTLWQARAAFLEAAGRIAVEVAVHGDVYTRHLGDGTEWRRVQPGSWPAEAAA
ncbi:hypothetical protein, partial [Deinococcus sp. 23YEL01]|uniref:hypothetical protein n=1 Tax=Deinococcus sp. 23YEL01 TaxID=2745871 RepID=UPI001E5B16D0